MVINTGASMNETSNIKVDKISKRGKGECQGVRFIFIKRVFWGSAVGMEQCSSRDGGDGRTKDVPSFYSTTETRGIS